MAVESYPPGMTWPPLTQKQSSCGYLLKFGRLTVPLGSGKGVIRPSLKILATQYPLLPPLDKPSRSLGSIQEVRG